MGCYINPKNETKEDFLLREGARLMNAPDASKITENYVPVCLVSNGLFTAAGVAYSAREIAAFSQEDGRQKFWFLVPRVAVRQVSDLVHYE